jgi:hypothetical protein
MAFSQTEKVMIEAVLAAFVERRRPPVHLREKLDWGFRIDNQSVEIFAVRPRHDDKKRKVQEPLAKATYVKTAKNWNVYWMRADLKWHSYGPAKTVKDIEGFIELVDEDKHNCFLG